MRKHKVRLIAGVGLAFVIFCGLPRLSVVSERDMQMKYVALTYDDGPNPVYTPQVLKVLEEEGVPATFFLMGEQVEDYPDLAKAIAKQRHEIGNHTYSHINISKVAEEVVVREMEKTNRLIFEVTGVYPELFRPPFGCDREELVKKQNMYQVFWDVDPKDWQVQNTDAVVSHVLHHVKEGDVILLHDAYATTVEATKQIISQLKKMGYTFVTVSSLLHP